MRKKLVIAADDLTGAGDTGVQFCKGGLTVHIIIGSDRFREEIDLCDVLVVDLESRMDAREVAYEKHFALGRLLVEYGEVLVYKKLDSTLRGNVGAEIEGLMDALGIGRVLLAPALPSAGRTVVNGEVFVRGVRLTDTEFAVDPRTPVLHSSIEEIVRLQSSKPCHLVPVGKEMGSKDGIYIFDSSEEKDLEDIAGLVERFGEGPVLLAGSSGLARHLGRGKWGGWAPRASGRVKFGGGGGSVFVFAGSVSGATQEQVRYAREKGNCVVIYCDEGNIAGVVDQVRDLMAKGQRRFIFTTSLSRADVRSETADIAFVFGKLAALLIRAFRPSGVLLTGGETAIHTANALGGKGIRVVGEVLPGIQYGYLIGGDASGCGIVTKAGGFGEEDTILRIFEFLIYA